MARSEITEVGKYRILGQIGEGAMGVVFRALDPVLNRPVAIKVMSDAVARDVELRGRFLREAQAAGSLQHPNVITIYDFGEVDGHLFIAMEFVEGADLEDVLRKKLPLSQTEKIDVLIDVLHGLSYAHKRGIVHRDIKPANIRIDQEGRARIMDFGIAHLTSSNMTRTGVMVGTPAYMAPEQIVGGEITPASDLFAVGAVMYELLSGAKPFQGETLQSVMYKIVSQPPPEIARVAPDVPAALATIVSRALAKEPTARFASALEMATALSAARSTIHEPTRTSTPLSLRSSIATALADEKAATSRTRRLRLFGAGTGGLVIVAALAFALWGRGNGQSGTASNSSTSQAQAPAPAPAVQQVPTPGVSSPVSTQPTTSPAASSATSSPSAGAARGGDLPPRTEEPASRATPPTRRVSVPPAPTVTATNPTAKELSLFRSLQSTAMQARRRAADAGATPDQLEAGDAHNRAASDLIAHGKVTEAADRLDQATTAWGAAERLARAAASAAATRVSAAEAPKPQPAVPPVVAPPLPQPQAAPAQQAIANPTAEINAVVAAYARAIESRDLAAVRRAYPAISTTQARGFEQFFGSVQTLRATFTVSGLEISGSSADARLVGAYDYVTQAGKPVQQPVTFQASFRREGTAWQIVSVREAR